MKYRVETEIGGRTLSLEIGEVAKQADGATLVRYGDTIVLVTACAKKEPAPNPDFFPLTVDYREHTCAAGKIPGGFFKREGRPSEKEILTCRMIDRPIRPLFPEDFFFETQIVGFVLSADLENDPSILSITGASTALYTSDIPFTDPVAAVRVGLIDGKFVIYPGHSELEKSILNLIAVGSKSSIVMVEANALEVSENRIIEAIEFGHEYIRKIIDLEEELFQRIKPTKREVVKREIEPSYYKEIENQATPKILEALKIKEKKERGSAFDELLDSLLEPIPEEEEDKIAETKYIYQEIKKKLVRKKILEEGVRIDGRQFKEIRPIECSVGLLPRTHGSAMFTRGETQALATVTLGTESDAQTINGLEEEFSKKFILHYNFPPFSVGEVKFLRGPGRREIGHGALAERSLLPVMPAEEKFPYTVRLVSDILESHGSSSMATVCAGALALMDAGVPIRAAVAGLALGLIQEGEKNVLLSDIAGEEDHYGDMDFKAAGTSKGITAIQLDIKIKGLSYQLISDALELAREGRLEILEKMREAIQAPRPAISPYAPRLLQLTIPLDKIGVVIGPGGKMIRGIIEKTGAKIDINDDGKVTIASTDEEAALKALAIIKELTAEAEIGRTYTGTIRKVVDFGAFVEILPGIEGLLHISEVADHRIGDIHRELKEGDKIVVKVINIDSQHRVQLSRKALLKNRDGERRPPYRNRRYE